MNKDEVTKILKPILKDCGLVSVRISYELIEDMLKKGRKLPASLCVQGLPEDAKLVAFEKKDGPECDLYFTTKTVKPGERLLQPLEFTCLNKEELETIFRKINRHEFKDMLNSLAKRIDNCADRAHALELVHELKNSIDL